MNKIHICGIYGCGKSTLAKRLSAVMDIPYYSLDDIKYKVKYDKIRPVEERIMLVNNISKGNKWITEGTWSNYAENAFKKADVIIFMQIPQIVCNYRILKRFVTRKKENKDTFLEALKLIREVYRYYFTKQPVSLYTHKEIIEKHNKKVVIIRNNQDISKFLLTIG